MSNWSVTLEEDPETGDLILPFPPDLLKQMGWGEGDILQLEVSGDNLIITKKQ